MGRRYYGRHRDVCRVALIFVALIRSLTRQKGSPGIFWRSPVFTQPLTGTVGVGRWPLKRSGPREHLRQELLTPAQAATKV